MGISQVQSCVFGCRERYNELKEAYDELKPKYNECYVEVEAYKQALKTLERQKI
jgi:predicted nuclease with TOPRIM domain